MILGLFEIGLLVVLPLVIALGIARQRLVPAPGSVVVVLGRTGPDGRGFRLRATPVLVLPVIETALFADVRPLEVALTHALRGTTYEVSATLAYPTDLEALAAVLERLDPSTAADIARDSVRGALVNVAASGRTSALSERAEHEVASAVEALGLELQAFSLKLS